MTLTDCEENACCSSSMQPISEQDPSDIGLTLREAVWQAQEQGRLRCGVIECAQLLEIDPFNVMICVMPATPGPDDVSAIIQRTLIEAFCHEYQIRLIKVDSVTKLGKVLEGRAPSTGLPPKPPRVPTATDMTSCVLVQYPDSGEASEAEELLVQHCKAVVCNDNFDPTIALPD